MPNLMFNGMAFIFRIRDLLVPRSNILAEVGLRPGQSVLDYGCGPGAYLPDIAKQVSPSGQIYALDLHPLAIRRVETMARRKGWDNVHTIQSDCTTNLPDDSIDVVLRYDILHMLGKPQAVLAELPRVLKPGGVLSVSDHHMAEETLLAQVTSNRTVSFRAV